MSLMSVFDIAGAGLAAQTKRMDLTASNLANADAVAGSEAEAYRAKYPIIESAFREVMDSLGPVQTDDVSVKVGGVVASPKPIDVVYNPTHPLANEEGYIFRSNVNPIEEMTNMLSASRGFQIQIDMLNTARQMAMRTLALGEG